MPMLLLAYTIWDAFSPFNSLCSHTSSIMRGDKRTKIEDTKMHLKGGKWQDCAQLVVRLIFKYLFKDYIINE